LVGRLCTQTDNPATDLSWDPKLYGTGAQILKALGVGKMRLMSAPQKMASLSGFGLQVVDYESASIR
jgi:3,4-dihydroxy 2-butanone 4-phosphate synthase/GTP cyclohydrolase II